MAGARLGQNFLVDRIVAQKIVAAFLPFPGPVLEVGPGKGILTEQLAGRASPLILVDVDPLLCGELELRFASVTRVMCADIRTVDPGLLFSGAEFGLIGNLPFLISSEMIDWIIGHHALIRKGVIMVQREFAAKLLAAAGSRERNGRGVAFQSVFRRRRLFRVLSGSFRPIPKVAGQVIAFERRDPPLLPDPVSFHRFLATAFSSPRKTLLNNLTPSFPENRLQEAFECDGLGQSCRVAELELDSLVRLFNRLTGGC